MNDTVTFYEIDKAVFIATENNTYEDEGWFYEAYPIVEDDFESFWWGVRVYDETGEYVGNL